MNPFLIVSETVPSFLQPDGMAKSKYWKTLVFPIIIAQCKLGLWVQQLIKTKFFLLICRGVDYSENTHRGKQLTTRDYFIVFLKEAKQIRVALFYI